MHTWSGYPIRGANTITFSLDLRSKNDAICKFHARASEKLFLETDARYMHMFLKHDGLDYS